jgi:hypothetical protein
MALIAISFFGTSISDQLIVSADHINWSGVSSPLGTHGGQGLVYGDKFVAVGPNSGNSTYISVTSIDDGLTWASHTMSQPSGEIRDMVYGGGLYVWADSNNGVIANSADGASWSSITFQTPGNQQSWISLAYGFGLYVVVSATSTGGDPNFASSSDAVTWSSAGSPTGLQLLAITFGGGLFVAVGGDSGPHAYVYTSPDGLNWTSRTPGSTKIWNGVAYGNGVYVAVSTTGESMTSADAFAWTSHAGPGAGSYHKLRFANGLFFACRNTSGSAIVTSPDGIAWTPQTTPQNNLYNVAFNPGVVEEFGNTWGQSTTHHLGNRFV